MTQLRIASNQRIIQAQTNKNQTNNKNSDNKPVPKPHLSPQNKHFPSQPITLLNPYSSQARAILRRHPHCQHDNTVPRLARLLDHRDESIPLWDHQPPASRIVWHYFQPLNFLACILIWATYFQLPSVLFLMAKTKKSNHT